MCLAETEAAPMHFPAAGIGTLAFLVHPEAVAVYPFYVALGWLRRKPVAGRGASAGRGFLFGLLFFALLLAGVTAVRFWYFHDLTPNTFHSKPSDLRLAIQNAYDFLMGQNANVAFPITGWLAIPVLLLGYRRLRRGDPAASDMLASVCGVGLLFAVYSPPDWTVLPRYFAPYLPAALILLWAGIGEALSLLLPTAGRTQARQAIAGLTALLLVLTNIFDGQAKMARMEDFPGYVLAGKNLIGPAMWLREHLPDGATIATRRIGAVAYYSHRNVFDYAYGLPEPDVARLVARHGGRFDTPTDPALAALWRARAPDYLLEDAIMTDYIVSQAGGVRGRFTIHGIEYGVVEQFPIGHNVEWVLAKRIGR